MVESFNYFKKECIYNFVSLANAAKYIIVSFKMSQYEAAAIYDIQIFGGGMPPDSPDAMVLTD